MADILHDLWIKESPIKVFESATCKPGLDHWWTKSSEGQPVIGEVYGLYFGPKYDWKAEVVACIPGQEFEWKMIEADADWKGSRIRFDFEPDSDFTRVRFQHLGWPEVNDHYRRSSFCWAMYLRALKRYVEHGEITPYAVRTSI